jgi:6-phosphogluconolactonase
MTGEPQQLVERFDDPAAMMRAAAERIVEQASAAITARGRFLFVLSGGKTPRSLYELLATRPYATRIDWPSVHIFWGDERCVPPEDPASNYRMAREALLDHVSLPPANIHRIHGEDNPEAAASHYEHLLRSHVDPRDQTFDLVLLGMGTDGHTASLFPGTPAAAELERWVVATRGPEREGWRVTLTRPALTAASNVTFLVSGADKAERLREVLEDHPASPLPAQLIHPKRGALHWMIDASAAARLTRR